MMIERTCTVHLFVFIETQNYAFLSAGEKEKAMKGRQILLQSERKMLQILIWIDLSVV